MKVEDGIGELQYFQEKIAGANEKIRIAVNRYFDLQVRQLRLKDEGKEGFLGDGVYEELCRARTILVEVMFLNTKLEGIALQKHMNPALGGKK